MSVMTLHHRVDSNVQLTYDDTAEAVTKDISDLVANTPLVVVRHHPVPVVEVRVLRLRDVVPHTLVIFLAPVPSSTSANFDARL